MADTTTKPDDPRFTGQLLLDAVTAGRQMERASKRSRFWRDAFMIAFADAVKGDWTLGDAKASQPQNMARIAAECADEALKQAQERRHA